MKYVHRTDVLYPQWLVAAIVMSLLAMASFAVFAGAAGNTIFLLQPVSVWIESF